MIRLIESDKDMVLYHASNVEVKMPMFATHHRRGEIRCICQQIRAPMPGIPETSTTLLRDIAQDSQNARWSEFVKRYRPMMEAYMRERFPSVEADDMIQETLIALCKILPSYRYAPDEKGAFHNYLTGILRNKAMRALRKRSCDAKALSGYADTGGWGRCRSGADKNDWRKSAFDIALWQFRADELVSDRTKRIFERTAIKGESPETVAASLKMTRHAVDQAKSRALSRIRELVKHLESVGNG